MKCALAAAMVLLGSGVSTAEPVKPFGVDLGVPLSQVTENRGDGHLHLLSASDVPTPNPLLSVYGAFEDADGLVCGVMGSVRGSGREILIAASKLWQELERKYPALPPLEHLYVNGPYEGVTFTQAFLEGDMFLQVTGYHGLPEPLQALTFAAAVDPERPYDKAGRLSLVYLAEPDCGSLLGHDTPAAATAGNGAGL
jgi:hypothetical protein